MYAYCSVNAMMLQLIKVSPMKTTEFQTQKSRGGAGDELVGVG